MKRPERKSSPGKRRDRKDDYLDSRDDSKGKSLSSKFMDSNYSTATSAKEFDSEAATGANYEDKEDKEVAAAAAAGKSDDKQSVSFGVGAPAFKEEQETKLKEDAYVSIRGDSPWWSEGGDGNNSDHGGVAEKAISSVLSVVSAITTPSLDGAKQDEMTVQADNLGKKHRHHTRTSASKLSVASSSQKSEYRPTFPSMPAPAPAPSLPSLPSIPALQTLSPVRSPQSPRDPPKKKASADVVWVNPRPQLKDLLRAAKGPSIVRRSNACGALKVLSAEKKNQFRLVRTIGLLDALIFAASETPIATGLESETAIDARTRAVTAIHYLSEPKDNRTLVFEHPGLAASMVKVIEEDKGEARVVACSVLATLAKTAQNRDEMVKVNDLVSTLAKVVGGKCDDDVVLRRQTSGIRNGEEDERTFLSNSTDMDEESTLAETMGGETPVTQEHTLSTGYTYDDDETKTEDKMEGETSPRRKMVRIMDQTQKEKSKNKPLKTAASMKQQKTDKYEVFLSLARNNACAALTHLAKHCPVSAKLCANDVLLDNLMMVSREFETQIHTRCVEILCHLTRFPANNAKLALNSEFCETLIKCGKSKMAEDRMWAIRALENLTADASSKITLATTPLLTLLTLSAMRKEYEEQFAAVGALLNLATEPGAVVPITNTKNVVATLVHLAHSSISTREVRQMACDALATVGLWLQTLAGAGTVPEGELSMPLPTHTPSGWLRWE